MEFWGVEVKVGETVKVDPNELRPSFLHIKQASLGDSEFGNAAPINLYLKIGDKKFVLSTLLKNKIPQTRHDLVFEKEFELSHNSTIDTVYFSGFKVSADESPPKKDQDDDDEFAYLKMYEDDLKLARDIETRFGSMKYYDAFVKNEAVQNEAAPGDDEFAYLGLMDADEQEAELKLIFADDQKPTRYLAKITARDSDDE